MHNQHDLDAYLDAAPPLLGLTLDPSWRSAIATHLSIALRFAALVQERALPDEAEPAPVFTP